MTAAQDFATTDGDRLFLVEGDIEAGRRLSNRLLDQKWRVVWAASAREAIQILHDAFFIEQAIDALLISHDLPDATAVRVIQEFRTEWPWAPVAMMIGHEDIAANIWARTHNIQLVHKPLDANELDQWLNEIRVPA